MPPEAEAYVAECLRRSRNVNWNKVRVWRDVHYGRAPHQLLDVFAPPDHEARALPAFLYMHGGGWVHGSKEWMSFMAPAITAIPLVLVVPNYGLAPEFVHPTPIEDCFAALAFIRQNAPRFGTDPDRFYIGGHSVGGHIAAMMALRPELQERYGIPGDAIRACVPVSGLFRVEPDDPTLAPDLQEASPVNWVRNASIPFFVTYGERDYDRIINENIEFIDVLGRQDATHMGTALLGHDHYGANLCNGDPDNWWSRQVAHLVAATA